MAAYVIFIRERTCDPSELETYSKMAPAGLVGHSVTFRALYGHHEVVEGPEVEGVAILEFPSFEEAKAWYNNPAYSAAREHRLKGGEYRGVIVEGWKPK
jgi:uncharacterized protein (DUF1330 family)